jgi:hypothetical protein
MADPIQRLESGRTQVAGVSGLPQPNLNFGQQRPEIEFQAQADYASNLSRVLSNLSTSMFGSAEKLADYAGAQFAAQNPPSQEQLVAMSQGNAGKFKKEFTLNAFSAAVQKYQANELSAHAEIELIQKVNEVQQNIDLGRDKNGVAYEVNTKKVIEDFQSMAKGWSDSLAQVNPDASYKYRATAATHVNRLITASAKKENELNLVKNKVKIIADVDNQFTNTITNIIKNGNVFSEKDNRYLTINEQIAAEREALVSRALPLGGADAVQYAIERSDAIEKGIKQGILEEAVISRRQDIGGDLVTLTTLIREKRLPADLQNIWDSLTVPQQKEARDKMVSQFQQQIDIKAKDREENKQDNVILANTLTMQFLDKNTNDIDRVVIQNQLRDISRKYPEIVSAKAIEIDYPKYMKEDIEDNYVNVANLEDLLRDKDPTLQTTEAILTWSTANGIKPKTALEIAGRYLPKDIKNKDTVLKTLDVEFLIRTKQIDPLTKRPITTVADAQKSYEIRGLSLLDAPDTLSALLAAKPEEPDDDAGSVAEILRQIDNDVITDAVEVYKASRGKRIKTETVIGLEKRVGDRRLQLQTSARSGGNDMADLSGSSNPATKARIKLEGQEAILAEHEKMVGSWKADGSKGSPPTIEDAKRVVTKRFNDQEEQKKIDNTKSSLNTNYGVNGSVLPKSVKEAKIDLVSIQPKFKTGKTVEVTDDYRKALQDSLKIGGASQSEIDSIVTAIIQQQVYIETINRRRSAR